MFGLGQRGIVISDAYLLYEAMVLHRRRRWGRKRETFKGHIQRTQERDGSGGSFCTICVHHHQTSNFSQILYCTHISLPSYGRPRPKACEASISHEHALVWSRVVFVLQKLELHVNPVHPLRAPPGLPARTTTTLCRVRNNETSEILLLETTGVFRFRSAPERGRRTYRRAAAILSRTWGLPCRTMLSPL